MAMASRPPGPSGLIRTLFSAMRGGGRLPWLKRLTEQYGDVVFFELPGTPPFAILNHPDYVRDVLVTNHRLFHKGLGLQRAKLLLGEGLLTNEEDFHARQRRLLLPAFHRERIAAYAATMAEYARRRSATWTGGATLNVAQEMAALTLAIAGKTLFDADVERDAATIGEALTTSLDSFNLVLMPFGDRLANAPIPPAIRFKRARARLDEIVYRLIAERRASGRVGADVLSMLVAAQDADGDRAGMTDVRSCLTTCSARSTSSRRARPSSSASISCTGTRDSGATLIASCPNGGWRARLGPRRTSTPTFRSAQVRASASENTSPGWS